MENFLRTSEMARKEYAKREAARAMNEPLPTNFIKGLDLTEPVELLRTGLKLLNQFDKSPSADMVLYHTGNRKLKDAGLLLLKAISSSHVTFVFEKKNYTLQVMRRFIQAYVPQRDKSLVDHAWDGIGSWRA